jgi:hypothetical protein
MDKIEIFKILQATIHYGGHFLLPSLIGYIFFKSNWKNVWFIMVCTMVVDLDHLLANPIFDPKRCSIGFHPLHTKFAIIAFIILLFPKKTRIIGLGLVLHMLIDFQDCFWIDFLSSNF